MKNTTYEEYYYNPDSLKPNSYFNSEFEVYKRYFENKWRKRLRTILKIRHKKIVLDKRLTGKRGTRK
jgi:hypothetical protein